MARRMRQFRNLAQREAGGASATTCVVNLQIAFEQHLPQPEVVRSAQSKLFSLASYYRVGFLLGRWRRSVAGCAPTATAFATVFLLLPVVLLAQAAVWI